MVPESAHSPPSPWCPEPGRWHAEDAYGTEAEVSALAAAFVTALQPEAVIETGSWTGQTTEAIGAALAASGHGRLWSLECDPQMAAAARARCGGLPVTVVVTDSLSWDPPPGSPPIGFAWLDSHIGARVAELRRWWHLFGDGAVIGLHDTGPQHIVRGELQPLLDCGAFTALHLRTPRGVTFGQITGELA